MAKTRIQYIKEAAKKLVDSKLQRLGAAKTQEIFKGVMQTIGLESMEEVYLFVAQFDLPAVTEHQTWMTCHHTLSARHRICSSISLHSNHWSVKDYWCAAARERTTSLSKTLW